jgi:RNA polymerase sigma-70 factor (ECF subfamily)
MDHKLMKTLLALVLFPLAALLLRNKDDSALLERLRNRDPEAMGELYDRYSRITYSLIYRVVRNQSVAEDLVQETFIRIWNRIQGFDQQKGALGPWILTVARNRSIDYVRSVDGRMAASSFEVEKMENPGVFSTLETDIMNMDRIRSLKAAFEKLDPNQRLVLELAYFEGMSQTEMAGKLQKPLGTVKTWVRGALKALREEMGEEAVA